MASLVRQILKSFSFPIDNGSVYDKVAQRLLVLLRLYSFPRFIIYNFLLFLLIYGGFGFLGLGFSVVGVWGLWCEAFWVFWGWGSLYNHKGIILGKKTRAL